jgi:hypothetical protein
MTPCRIADTRDAGFPAGFGPPTLNGNASRTFAIQSPSSLCPVPSIAQAYSFNITIVPPGTTFPGMVNPSGALGHLTMWPTGQPQPVVSTLNSFLGTVVANAAIVPAGTGGAVDVFVSNNTDLIIDINGYYAPQSGITLAQGTAAAPSLSFSGDAGTGIFSSGLGTLNITTGGTNRLTVRSDGDLDLKGNIRKNGTLFLHTTGPFGDNLGVGLSTLQVNAAGSNTAVGYFALSSNSNGDNNTAIGHAALDLNTSGSDNVATGEAALDFNTSGSKNIAIGVLAGTTTNSANANATGSTNTFIGYAAGPRTGTQLDNATAIGANATVSASNALVLGSINGVNGATADTNVAVGLTAPHARLDVEDTTGTQIRFGDTIGDSGGYVGSTQPSQAFVAGGARRNGSSWIPRSTAAEIIDTNNGGIHFYGDTGLTVGMSYTPTEWVSIASTGIVTINALGSGGGSNTLCRNSSNQISMCGSSIRYKTNLKPFNSGMDLIRRLHPVSFNWNDGGAPDFGLVAEDVAKVEPLLVTRNDEGQIEGIKYDRIGVLLINAIEEQQKQIEDQKKSIADQQEQNRKLEERLAAVEKLLSTMQANTAAQ